jgi:hypothetical protein
MTAVALLVLENKPKDAREMFAPVAYDPHLTSDMRERAGKIMAALDSGNAKSALPLLQSTSEAGKK